MKILINPSTPSFMRVQGALTTGMHSAFKNLRNDVKEATPWNNIQSALANAIVFARQEGYKQAAASVGKVPRSSDLVRLRLDGLARADWVAQEMKGWTEQSLQASKKSKLLSKDRAGKVSVYESRKGFFDGIIKGGMLNKQSRKEWFTSDAHDQDDLCDDNEDDGVIDMSEAFTSGDMAPPGHLFCECSLWLHV